MTREAWDSSGFKLANGKKYGIKTLFSKQTNIHDIDNMRKILLSNEAYKIGTSKYKGIINGDTIKSYIRGSKATSIYPDFLIGE